MIWSQNKITPKRTFVSVICHKPLNSFLNLFDEKEGTIKLLSALKFLDKDIFHLNDNFNMGRRYSSVVEVLNN